MSNELKACNSERLTNLAISQNYQDIEIWCLPSEILGAFAYWVTAQNPNVKLIDIRSALRAFREHVVSGYFKNAQIPEMFTPERLSLAINEKAFADIPEILELNQMKPDFIDLGALARNVYYMILREHITQDDHIGLRPTEPKKQIAEGLKYFMVNHYAGQFIPEFTGAIMDKITDYYPDVKFGEEDVNEILCVLHHICEVEK